MKNKFVVASLTAIALVTLSACGSTVQGAAVGGAVGQTAEAPTAPSDPTSGDDTTVPGTSDAETTTSDDETTTSDDETTTSDDETTTSDDETTTSEDETTTSDDETTTSDDETTGTTDLEACTAVSDFTTAFAAMIQKIQTGTISQADVDKVFSAEVKAGLPASAQPTFEKLKDLSNRMVGKSITELADVATELTDGANDLRDIIKKACGVG